MPVQQPIQVTRANKHASLARGQHLSTKEGEGFYMDDILQDNDWHFVLMLEVLPQAPFGSGTW